MERGNELSSARGRVGMEGETAFLSSDLDAPADGRRDPAGVPVKEGEVRGRVAMGQV